MREERALKVDSGFKINMICLQDEDTSAEQKHSIALMMKESLERAQRIINRNDNPHLKLILTKEEQDFINGFLEEEEKIQLV